MKNNNGIQQRKTTMEDKNLTQQCKTTMNTTITNNTETQQ
jgi:hypothetical protein